MFPGRVDVARAEPYAVVHNHIRYNGKSVHAAEFPEHGVNAADAFTIAQVAIGLSRVRKPRISALFRMLRVCLWPAVDVDVAGRVAGGQILRERGPVS